jgi:hypothetical protein
LNQKDCLEYFNQHFNIADEHTLSNFDRSGFGNLFLIGLPRCASSFFIQILLSISNIGYINNRLAKFYKTPVIGLLIDQMLGKPDYLSTLNSTYGNTQGDHEPHEWGWFWQNELDLNKGEHYIGHGFSFKRIDRLLSAISDIKEVPVIYDSVFAMLNVALLKKKTSNTFVVYLKRDPFYIANSILNARELRYGNISSYYGYPPTNMNDLQKIKNPVEQVIAQVHSCINDIEESLKVFPEKDVFEIDYEDLVINQKDQIVRFENFVRDSVGFNLDFDYEKLESLPPIKSRNEKKLINKNCIKELEHYYKKYFHQ